MGSDLKKLKNYDMSHKASFGSPERRV